MLQSTNTLKNSPLETHYLTQRALGNSESGEDKGGEDMETISAGRKARRRAINRENARKSRMRKRALEQHLEFQNEKLTKANTRLRQSLLSLVQFMSNQQFQSVSTSMIQGGVAEWLLELIRSLRHGRQLTIDTHQPLTSGGFPVQDRSPVWREFCNDVTTVDTADSTASPEIGMNPIWDGMGYRTLQLGERTETEATENLECNRTTKLQNATPLTSELPLLFGDPGLLDTEPGQSLHDGMRVPNNASAPFGEDNTCNGYSSLHNTSWESTPSLNLLGGSHQSGLNQLGARIGEEQTHDDCLSFQSVDTENQKGAPWY
eukprot:gb/GECG01003567.1/.p1 GENE.gb/GECG01003567.1/~~gb/GECG01003567.1/.p1  ORF type:complete len:318 (+),score=43.14 gb/GECG01003567.1/:1-954(+)